MKHTSRPDFDIGMALSPAPHSPALTISEISHGIATDAFRAYYQPKIDLRDGSVCGAEVLARWNHPRLGLLTPASFLPLMEAYRHADTLFARLFARMFEQGLALQQDLLRRGRRINLAFNVQPGQLAGAAFVDDILGRLAKAGLPASGLTFEVVESDHSRTPAQLERLLANMQRLRRMGCGLAMDDLGQGHSSLARLCQFPFSQLKLDAAFVRALDQGGSSRAVVRAMLSLARELDLDIVAEGVETDAQRQRLVDMGCEIGQGFGLAPPLSRAALMMRLRRSAPFAG